MSTTKKQTENIVNVNFDKFRLENGDPEGSFEQLCYFLFCRTYKISDGISGYRNQTGIEKPPVSVGKRVIGFQSKFFESNINYKSLEDGLRKAKAKHPKLNNVIFYVNKLRSESSKKSTTVSSEEQVLIDSAKELKIEISWFDPGNFSISLNQPGNLDLGQIYFGEADNYSFIKNDSNLSIQTFIQSEGYLKLPLSSNNKIMVDPVKSILSRKQKVFLLLGHPGSGKSIFSHALFRDFSGLNKKNKKEMLAVWAQNKAIPMIINLKDCVNENLEGLIRDRQNDFSVRNKKLDFIYIFDGLDELSPEKADQTLFYIRNLEQLSTTKKIIISCRSGNSNKTRAAVYLPKAEHFCFSSLDNTYIDLYFKSKNNKIKDKYLSKLKKNNKLLISEIVDILFIKLLWDTIEELNEKSTVADLIEENVQILLYSPDHKKNIETLNILDEKPEKILTLNQEISFRSYQKFQFRLPKSELQDIIASIFPRADYNSTNEILNYLTDLFFENSYLDNETRLDYIYRHRRYQEFFFIQRLKLEYEKDPFILRRTDVLSNRDFFEQYFLKYLRKCYEKNNDIVGLLDINLLDVYLGNHTGYGVDDAYYHNSSEFIPALANQEPGVMEELLESDSFKMKKMFFLDLDYLNKTFDAWDKDKNDYKINDKLSGAWSSIGPMIENAVIFWKSGKKEFSQKIITHISKIQDIFHEKDFFKNKSENTHVTDPFWQHWSDFIYILIVIKKRSASKVLEDQIRVNYKFYENENDKSFSRENNKEKLINSFYYAILSVDDKFLISNLNKLDTFEFNALLGVLLSFDGINTLLVNRKIQNLIKKRLILENVTFGEENYHISFYKTYFGLSLNDEETTLLKQLLVKTRNERKVDWHMYNIPHKFSIISYALNENKFSQINNDPNDNFKYLDELELYSALFDSYINIIKTKSTIGLVLRNYFSYIKERDDRLDRYLKTDISFLWAQIFSKSLVTTIKVEDLFILKEKLLGPESGIIPWSFYYKLVSINKELFDKLINQTDLNKIEVQLKKFDDYQSLVNDCFSLSLFYSKIDQQKAREYFVKGLKESVLRHGWRKDSLVSHQLVDSLEILIRNNCETTENIKKYLSEIFELTLHVSSFTDGAVTWKGPYNVIELASKFDISFANELRKTLIKDKGYRNYNNQANTYILLGKVRIGTDLDEIKEGILEYRQDYNHDNKPNSDSYEHKIKVYVEVSKSPIYSEEDKKAAFEIAYNLVEEMKTEGITYFLRDIDYKDLKVSYIELCNKYNKTVNVEFDEKNNSDDTNKISNKDLHKILIGLTNKAKIKRFYKKLEDYKNGIVISNRDSWELLLNRTFKYLGNIAPFTETLTRYTFPHTDWFTSNSPYFYLGVSVALGDLRMKKEMELHLYKNTGHGGFVNMMKAYELINDKDMCKKLFQRYLQLCHFLSD